MKLLNQEELEKIIAVDQLSDGSIFGALSNEAIKFLLHSGNVISLDKGDQLFRLGEQGDHFFIVLNGKLGFIKHHKEKSFPTRTVEYGEALAFVSMIALHDHTGDAIALEDSLVLEITPQLYGELHQQYPSDFGIMTLNLARDMARTIRKLNNMIVKKST